MENKMEDEDFDQIKTNIKKYIKDSKSQYQKNQSK